MGRAEKRPPHLKVFEGDSWAVFNSNESDMQAVKGRFTSEEWRQIKACKRTGVMEVFEYEPTPLLKRFVRELAIRADARHDRRLLRREHNNRVSTPNQKG